MLELKGLAEMYVIDANDQGHTSDEIMHALMQALIPLREKERIAATAKAAKELTLESVEDQLGHAMSEYWDSEDVDELQDAMEVRFPKHKKKIASIFELAGDVSNEREDMGRYGPSKDYERGWSKVMDRLQKLPW
jgi:hypothetical protein